MFCASQGLRSAAFSRNPHKNRALQASLVTPFGADRCRKPTIFRRQVSRDTTMLLVSNIARLECGHDFKQRCFAQRRSRSLPGRRFPSRAHHPDVRGQPRDRPGHRHPGRPRRRQYCAAWPRRASPMPSSRARSIPPPQQIEAAGGQALPLVGDVRNDDDVAAAVAAAVERFGGIDVVVNNASAIDLSPTPRRGHEALRPDAGHQCPRDVPAFQARPAGAPGIRRRPDPDAFAAPEPGPQVGRHAPCLHHGQVRHEPDHAGACRGAEGRRRSR